MIGSSHAGHPYENFIIIKHDNNREQKQIQTPTGQTEKVKVKRVTPTWTGHKFSSNSNE